MSNSNNQQFSNKMLDAAREAMDSLIEGSSEMYRAAIFLNRLHDDKGFPVDSQKMSEISQMMLSMRKTLFEQRAEVDLQLACINDDKRVDEMLSGFDNIFEIERADA